MEATLTYRSLGMAIGQSRHFNSSKQTRTSSLICKNSSRGPDIAEWLRTTGSEPGAITLQVRNVFVFGPKKLGEVVRLHKLADLGGVAIT